MDGLSLMMQGISGVVSYSDEIFVYGTTDERYEKQKLSFKCRQKEKLHYELIKIQVKNGLKS